MAISDSVPGIEVIIEVDGQPAKEYDPPRVGNDGDPVVPNPPVELDTDDNKPHAYVVKYIESKTGVSFQFEVTKRQMFHRYGHHIAYIVEFDGKRSTLSHEHDQGHRPHIAHDLWTHRSRGINYACGEDPTRARSYAFQFAELEAGPLILRTSKSHEY